MLNIKLPKINWKIINAEISESTVKAPDSEDLAKKELQLKNKEPWENIKQKIKEEDDFSKYKDLGDSFNLEESNFNNLLKNLGLSSKQFISRGKYSLVFNKNGVIYKFTKNKKDIEKMLFFHALKDKLPEKYQSHIVEVFDYGYDEESKFYYLSCEKLYPLSQMKKQLLLRNSYPTSNSISTFFTKRIYTDLIQILEDIQEDDSMRSTFAAILKTPGLNKQCYDEILKAINENKHFNNFAKEINKAEIAVGLDRENLNKIKVLQQTKEKIYLQESEFIISAIYNFINNKMNKINLSEEIYNESVITLKEMMSKLFKRFPMSHVDDIESPTDKDYFGGELLEFLRYLKDNYGIYFNDMHTNNFMERSSGDLVLADVGYFQFA